MAYQASKLWPTYFQPLQAPPSPTLVRLPTDVIDLFYLRWSSAYPATLVAVLRCLGGGLEIVAGETLECLSSELLTQIRTAEINYRQLFRTITAHELYVFGLDAVEQAGAADGFNDALYLHGQMQARLSMAATDVQITSLEAQGRLTVGRLDLLHGFRIGAVAAFRHPRSTDEQVFHMLVPAEGPADIEHGRGLVLVYPVLDPATFASVDNSFVAWRIIHDVLASLQHDIHQADDTHPFATAMLPVPSRQRVEAELAHDGYVITGNTAVKQVRGDEHTGSFLARLRTWARQWSEPHIVLPPQATTDEYVAIVDGIVPAVATTADGQMMQAMEARVSWATRPPKRLAPASAALERPAGASEQAPSGSPQSSYTGETVRLAPKPPEPIPSQSDAWAQDFALPARLSRRQQAKRVAALPGTPAALGAPGTLTSKADWIEDVQAERMAFAARTHRQQHDVSAARDTWNDDFASPPHPPASAERPQDDWSRDFE